MQRNKENAVVCCVAPQAHWQPAASVEFTPERLCDVEHSKKAATPATRWCSKRKNARGSSHGNAAKQAPIVSSEIVKLIRKLRWVGLEDKAQQLENELERHVVTDTVVSIQNETD